jgi:citrate synthase
MLIGKPGPAKSALCSASASHVEIRGRDLCDALMGRMSFTDYFFFLVTGRDATDDQRFFLDTLLIAIAEHGLTPTAQAARMTYDADPQSLQAAVAAGILGCGTVIVGASEQCGQVLTAARTRIEAGEELASVVADIARQTRAAGGRMPGFGHPLHRPVDPRSRRILALVREKGIASRHLDIAIGLEAAVAEAWGRPLVMNVSMPIAAVLLDLEFPASMIKAIPILARTAGLLAHIAEEQQRPIGFLMASHGEDAISYDGGA